MTNRHEEALTSSEGELRLLVEAIPALVWRAGPEGNIEYVNKRLLEYLGAPLGEVREALDCVVGDADRAGAIVDRIRDHIRKAPPRKHRFDLNEAIKR